MSRLRSYEPERVELPDDNEAWVTPAFASQGFTEWYESLPEADRPEASPPLPAEAIFAMLAAGITAWSLTDDEGERVPVNHESVSRLSWAVGKPLADWCNQLVTDATRELFAETGRALQDGPR